MTQDSTKKPSRLDEQREAEAYFSQYHNATDEFSNQEAPKQQPIKNSTGEMVWVEFSHHIGKCPMTNEDAKS
jgi:hypothetical protein